MALPTVTIQGKVLTPSGVAPTSGAVRVRLSKAGSALDGATSQRVAGEVSATLGVDGSLSLALVPNDAIVPSGTVYEVDFAAIEPNGVPVRWHERWQLASTPSPIDLGAVPRLDVVPGVAVGVQNARMNLMGIWIGDSPPASPVTYAQWIATGVGYWGWLDTSTPGVSLLVPVADLSLTATVPAMQNGWAWVDLFSDGALNATRFGSAVAGSGTVVETTQLTLNSPGASDAALVYLKTAVAKGVVRTFKIRFIPQTSDVFHVGLIQQATPAPTVYAGIDDAGHYSNQRFLLGVAPGANSTITYVDTTNTQQYPGTYNALALTAGTEYEAAVVSTATTLAMTLTRVSDSAVLASTPTVLWSSVKDDATNPYWIVFGDRYSTVHACNNTKFTRFEVA